MILSGGWEESWTHVLLLGLMSALGRGSPASCGCEESQHPPLFFSAAVRVPTASQDLLENKELEQIISKGSFSYKKWWW